MENTPLHERKILTLKLAIDKLKKGENYFICSALADVGMENPALITACALLKTYIAKAIYPYLTLNTWQGSHVGPVLPYPLESRIAWCEWMINCLEADNGQLKS